MEAEKREKASMARRAGVIYNSFSSLAEMTFLIPG